MRTILLVVCFGLAGFVRAQTIEFSRIYKVWCEFSNNNFEQTSDGGYIICSDAIPEMDTLNSDPRAYGYLIKLDPYGNPQWMKKFEKSNNEIKPMDGNSVCQTYDGGYAIATSYYTLDTVSSTYRTYTYLIKTDPLGNHIWSRMYAGVGSSRPLCIKEAQNHDLIVCGSTTDSSNTAMHGNFLMRTTSTGSLLWAKGFSPGSNFNSGEFSAVTETTSGDLMVCGNIVQQGLIMRTDANGNIIWSAYTASDMNTDVEEEANGNVVVVGYTSNFSYTMYFEMDSAGTPLHSYYYNTSPYTGASIVPTWDGVTIVGNGVNTGVLLLHMTTTGNVLWNVTYADADGMLRPDLERTADSGYAFAAQHQMANASSPFDWAVIVIKTDSLGDIPCHDSLMTFPKYNFPPPTPISMMSISANTEYSKTTVMIPVLLHDSDLCANAANQITDQHMDPAFSVYPNPACDELNIVGERIAGNELVIRLYNAEGQLVISSSVQVHNRYSGTIDMSAQAPGLYFLEIESDGVPLSRQKIIRE